MAASKSIPRFARSFILSPLAAWLAAPLLAAHSVPAQTNAVAELRELRVACLESIHSAKGRLDELHPFAALQAQRERAAGAALEGAGTIGGPVTLESGGNLAPGASIGTLTISSNRTLAGNLFIEVNRSASPSNDWLVVTGTLTKADAGGLIQFLDTQATNAHRFYRFGQ
jgi:hypothetical protein